MSPSDLFRGALTVASRDLRSNSRGLKVWIISGLTLLAVLGAAFGIGAVVSCVQQAAEDGAQPHHVEVRPADDAGLDHARLAEPDHGEVDGFASQPGNGPANHVRTLQRRKETKEHDAQAIGRAMHRSEEPRVRRSHFDDYRVPSRVRSHQRLMLDRVDHDKVSGS